MFANNYTSVSATLIELLSSFCFYYPLIKETRDSQVFSSSSALWK